MAKAFGPLRLLLLAVILALGLAVGASYAIVVSENPASAVEGPATDYGPVQ